VTDDQPTPMPPDLRDALDTALGVINYAPLGWDRQDAMIALFVAELEAQGFTFVVIPPPPGLEIAQLTEDEGREPMNWRCRRGRHKWFPIGYGTERCIREGCMLLRVSTRDASNRIRQRTERDGVTARAQR
jgi:hypothetical protein